MKGAETMTTVYAKTVYTGTKVINNGYLDFEGRDIVDLSDSPQGEVADRFDTITPAFVDAHAHIGMVRAGEPSYESETNEKLDSLLAHADALDSVQMDDSSFRDAVEEGVLYSCIVPGSGNIIGGKSAVVRNYAKNTSEALIARAGIKAAFGYNPMSTRDWKGSRPFTRMGALALLRQKLHDVRLKMQKEKEQKGEEKEKVTYSAEESVLKTLLEKKDLMRVHVHKIDDVAALLRFSDEFDLRIVVDHAGDINDPHIFEELRRRGIPVVYGPVDSFAYKVELKHESWRNIRHLLDSGVTYGLMTDHPVSLQKMLFLQTRWFVRCGLTKAQAIELVTLKNATILGIEARLGSLEKGKWASFCCWNGDPFDMTSHPVAVYGEGTLLYKD
jgi:imidazolonepropionase-like amidohydrolase